MQLLQTFFKHSCACIPRPLSRIGLPNSKPKRFRSSPCRDSASPLSIHILRSAPHLALHPTPVYYRSTCSPATPPSWVSVLLFLHTYSLISALLGAACRWIPQFPVLLLLNSLLTIKSGLDLARDCPPKLHCKRRRSKVFKKLGGISKSSGNLPSITYQRMSITALFPAGNVLKIPCLNFSLISSVKFTFSDL